MGIVNLNFIITGETSSKLIGSDIKRFILRRIGRILFIPINKIHTFFDKFR